MELPVTEFDPLTAADAPGIGLTLSAAADPERL
jgi:hypothetical protein